MTSKLKRQKCFIDFKCTSYYLINNDFLKQLKCHYYENHIFSIEAKQVACMRRKLLFTIFKYLFSGLYIRAGSRRSSPAPLPGFAGYFHCFTSLNIV